MGLQGVTIHVSMMVCKQKVYVTLFNRGTYIFIVTVFGCFTNINIFKLE